MIVAWSGQLPIRVNLRARGFRPVGTTDRSLAVYCQVPRAIRSVPLGYGMIWSVIYPSCGDVSIPIF